MQYYIQYRTICTAVLNYMYVCVKILVECGMDGTMMYLCMGLALSVTVTNKSIVDVTDNPSVTMQYLFLDT